MLNMGFIEDVEKILGMTPPERQTALFSATMPPRIRTLANRFMRDPQSVTAKKSTLNALAIEQRYYLVHENDKTNALTRLFEIEPIHSALIFARTRAETTRLQMNWWCAESPLKPFTAIWIKTPASACLDVSAPIS
jgi:ATP-dependent RNA helicase DeaD